MFFVHDLGYYNKEKMDDEDGEMHPWFGARLMTRLFDRNEKKPSHLHSDWHLKNFLNEEGKYEWLGYWGRMTLFHSRYLSKKYNIQYSKLCPADKLAVAMEPWWLYLPRVIATGEIHEYMEEADSGKYVNAKYETTQGYKAWFDSISEYMSNYAWEHKDGKKDYWTPEQNGELKHGK